MNQESTDIDARESFNRAFDAHRSGNLDSAEALYREILAAQPENVHVTHLLGLIALQKGRLHDARELIKAAIEGDDSHALFHCNLGEAYRLLGELDEAEHCFLAALEREPRYPQALTNLGITLHQLERHAEAVSRLQRVLDLAGPSADAYSNLGLAQLASGAIDEAISSLRKAVELNPHHVEANNNLGAALLEKNEIQAAAFVLEDAVSVDPNSADAWCNLARARLAESDLAAAEAHARRAIELDPGRAKFHWILGLVLSDALRPKEAESALRRSLELAPDQAVVHYALATVFIRVGRFEEAEAALRRSLALNPGLTIAYEALSQIHSYGTDDLPEIERLEQLALGLNDEYPGRMHLEFALAKMLEDCREFHRAFSHLQAANKLKQAQVSFDAAELWRILEDTQRTVDRALIQQKACFGSDSEIPILIIGMPHSGTALVEQILASHPEVSGAGEVGYLNAAARDLGVSYPLCLTQLSETVVRGLVAGYLERLAKDRSDARYVTDRRPDNFVHLGLFSMLFPRARIIHCIREPVDTCFSIYSQNFEQENEFAYDLGHIAEYYRFYRSIMAHWQSVLPIRIFDVSYEALVGNQERVSRDLLDHCGLTWDDRCLRPHESKREIRTASPWQVRQPVYSSSVARWRHYQRHLGPLIEALGEYAQFAKKT